VKSPFFADSVVAITSLSIFKVMTAKEVELSCCEDKKSQWEIQGKA